MALPLDPSRLVRDESGLCAAVFGLKLLRCPHCRQTGALIGHGSLRGYGERSSDVAVRGQRVFCSNRGRRPGRGRMFSVLRESGLKGFVVRTLTLFCFANAMLGGLTRRAAWLSETVSAASRSSGGLD